MTRQRLAQSFSDVAYFGPDGVAKVLVVSSGTHGVEGFAGSGIQVRLLREGVFSTLPPNTGLLMIHAINPYGMAHWRRSNEDNVDLNRNFRDHSIFSDPNLAYEAIADVIAPASVSFWSEVRSWLAVALFRLRAGDDAVQAAVSGGQYSHPEGLFYGGQTPTWSNRTLGSIVR